MDRDLNVEEIQKVVFERAWKAFGPDGYPV